MLRLWTKIEALVRSEEGASLVEYALLVALIAIVAIAAIILLGQNASSVLSEAGASMASS
jgi:pilus assembly protein Flp/PilA